MPRTTDFVTQAKTRLAVVTIDQTVNLLVETPDLFATIRLTHQEARRLAHKLMGSSDPYLEANEA